LVNSIQLRIGFLILSASFFIHFGLRLIRRADRSTERQSDNNSGYPGNVFHFGLLIQNHQPAIARVFDLPG